MTLVKIEPCKLAFTVSPMFLAEYSMPRAASAYGIKSRRDTRGMMRAAARFIDSRAFAK